jgi:hypothetical protein
VAADQGFAQGRRGIQGGAGIGHLDDDLDRLLRAAAYLRRVRP